MYIGSKLFMTMKENAVYDICSLHFISDKLSLFAHEHKGEAMNIKINI
jgi:hypothetical protein